MLDILPDTWCFITEMLHRACVAGSQHDQRRINCATLTSPSDACLLFFRCAFCARADNVEYGFDPHDDSDYLTIVGNDVWGNGEQRNNR